jgi:NIMA-interacting peptidyl-prolyl cis-trans isomerase 4
MAPKNNAKAGKGKGKEAATDDKGKGGKGAVKGAQSINVRHILVCILPFFCFLHYLSVC